MNSTRPPPPNPNRAPRRDRRCSARPHREGRVQQSGLRCAAARELERLAADLRICSRFLGCRRAPRSPDAGSRDACPQPRSSSAKPSHRRGPMFTMRGRNLLFRPRGERVRRLIGPGRARGNAPPFCDDIVLFCPPSTARSRPRSSLPCARPAGRIQPGRAVRRFGPQPPLRPGGGSMVSWQSSGHVQYRPRHRKSQVPRVGWQAGAKNTASGCKPLEYSTKTRPPTVHILWRRPFRARPDDCPPRHRQCRRSAIFLTRCHCFVGFVVARSGVTKRLTGGIDLNILRATERYDQ